MTAAKVRLFSLNNSFFSSSGLHRVPSVHRMQLLLWRWPYQDLSLFPASTLCHPCVDPLLLGHWWMCYYHCLLWLQVSHCSMTACLPVFLVITQYVNVLDSCLQIWTDQKHPLAPVAVLQLLAMRLHHTPSHCKSPSQCMLCEISQTHISRIICRLSSSACMLPFATATTSTSLPTMMTVTSTARPSKPSRQNLW